jgi:hypothetical protein
MEHMIFMDEVEYNGKVYVTFKSLELSGVVNLVALKYNVEKKNILPYRIWITEGRSINPDSTPSACLYPAGETHVNVRPYFPREGDTGIIWIYTSYCKPDLEEIGLIPREDASLEKGLPSAFHESRERTIQAAYFVGKWIAESGISRGETTKSKVQDILGQNAFGYGDTALFKDIWDAIPYSDKYSEVDHGGDPQNWTMRSSLCLHKPEKI